MASIMQQTYEDFKPLVEQKEIPDALLLLVHVPGFSKEQIGVSLERGTRKIKVFGEKPIDDNRRKRFKEEYLIPQTCDSDKLEGKFDGTTITITMPKKPVSDVAPKAPKPIVESKSSDVEAERAVKEDKKGVSQEQSKSEMESPRESDKTPTPPEPITGESGKPQKDKEEIPQKGINEEEKHRDEMEAKDASTPEKVEGESRMSQKDQQGTPQKGKVENEKHMEDRTTKKTSEEGKEPQKAETLTREASKDKGTSGMKTPEKKKENEVKTGKINQRDRGMKESELSVAKGFKDIANSASQAVTKLADKVRKEDKQKLLYAGAAILIVAAGIYANFKLRTGRQ